MAGAVDVLRYASVRRYLLSSTLSSGGLMLLVTGLYKQVYDITGDTLDIGLIGLAQFVPALLLVLVSGMVADRFDRRRIVALFLLGRAGCAAMLVAYTISDSTSVWPLFATAFVLGVVDAMLAPAHRSMPPLVSPDGLLPRVVGMWTATFTSAMIVGPALGGFLYSIDPSLPYIVAGAVFVTATVPVLAIEYQRAAVPVRERPTLRMALEGLHFVRRTPVVLAAISLDLFAVLFGGAVALIPAVAEDRLGVGDIAYGWLRAAPGIGAGLMAIVLAVWPVRRRVGPTLLMVVAMFGFGTIVFGITRNYAVAFAALVVLSGADMISMYIRGSLVPLVTPDDQLGRVTAVEGVFIGASNELGAFESGVAASALGVPLAIAAGGVATVAIAGTYFLLFPSLRRIDTFEELDRPAETAVGSRG
ncbi:MAG TPA: MFS transporter [Ilumatobacteraceae bacterium]|nr:MFS transporter [Ilumatobacteraceae bacterium]